MKDPAFKEHPVPQRRQTHTHKSEPFHVASLCMLTRADPELWRSHVGATRGWGQCQEWGKEGLQRQDQQGQSHEVPKSHLPPPAGQIASARIRGVGGVLTELMRQQGGLKGHAGDFRQSL